MGDQIALGQGASRVLIDRLGGNITIEDFDISVRYDFAVRQEPSILVVFSFREGVVLDPAGTAKAEASFIDRPVALEVNGRIYSTGALTTANEPGSGGVAADTDPASSAFLWVGIVLGTALVVATVATVLRARTANRKLASLAMSTPMPSYFDDQSIHLDRTIPASGNHFYPEAGMLSSAVQRQPLDGGVGAAVRA